MTDPITTALAAAGWDEVPGHAVRPGDVLYTPRSGAHGTATAARPNALIIRLPNDVPTDWSPDYTYWRAPRKDTPCPPHA